MVKSNILKVWFFGGGTLLISGILLVSFINLLTVSAQNSCRECAQIETELTDKEDEIDQLRKFDEQSPADFSGEIKKLEDDLIELEAEQAQCCGAGAGGGNDSGSNNNQTTGNESSSGTGAAIDGQNTENETEDSGITNYRETDCLACAEIKQSIFDTEAEIAEMELIQDDSRVVFDVSVEINRLKKQLYEYEAKYKKCFQHNCSELFDGIEVGYGREQSGGEGGQSAGKSSCAECVYIQERIAELKIKATEAGEGSTEKQEYEDKLTSLLFENNKCLEKYCPKSLMAVDKCIGCYLIHKQMIALEKKIRSMKQNGETVDQDDWNELDELKMQFRQCIGACRNIPTDDCPDCETLLLQIKEYEQILTELFDSEAENTEEIARIDRELQNLYQRYKDCVVVREQREAICDPLPPKECPDCMKYQEKIQDLTQAIKDLKEQGGSEEEIQMRQEKLEYLYRAYQKCLYTLKKLVVAGVCEFTEPEWGEDPVCPDCDYLKGAIQQLKTAYDQALVESNSEEAEALWWEIKFFQEKFTKCLNHLRFLRTQKFCERNQIKDDPETEKDCPNCTKLERELQIMLEKRFILLEQENIMMANSLLELINQLKEKLQRCWNKWQEQYSKGYCPDPSPGAGAESNLKNALSVDFEGTEFPDDSFFDVFVDVDVDNSNSDGIGFLKRQGVVVGYQDGSFKPKQSVNRAEFTKMMVEAAEISPDPDLYQNCFSDVHEEWFAKYICYAYAQGWVAGYNDKLFHPERLINKVEALKILIEVFSLGDQLSEVLDQPIFSDVSKEAWYSLYVAFAKLNDLLEDEDNDFYPGDDMTRGAMSELIYRLIMMLKVGEVVYE